MNFRQLCTQIEEGIQNVISSLQTVMGEFGSVLKETMSALRLILTFVLTIFQHPVAKNGLDTCLIIFPIILIATASLFYKNYIALLTIPLYILVVIFVTAWIYYKFSHPISKSYWVWYVFGMVFLALSLMLLGELNAVFNR